MTVGNLLKLDRRALFPETWMQGSEGASWKSACIFVSNSLGCYPTETAGSMWPFPCLNVCTGLRLLAFENGGLKLIIIIVSHLVANVTILCCCHSV